MRPIFKQLFTQHSKWMRNFSSALTSLVPVRLCANTRPSCADADSWRASVFVLCTKLFKHTTWMCAPFTHTAQPKLFWFFLFVLFFSRQLSTLVQGWKIGHWAGWWIWAAFIIYESSWVTSSHLIISHIEDRTNWTTFAEKIATHKNISLGGN